jgi:hypothetical protein
MMHAGFAERSIDNVLDFWIAPDEDSWVLILRLNTES